MRVLFDAVVMTLLSIFIGWPSEREGVVVLDDAGKGESAPDLGSARALEVASAGAGGQQRKSDLPVLGFVPARHARRILNRARRVSPDVRVGSR